MKRLLTSLLGLLTLTSLLFYVSAVDVLAATVTIDATVHATVQTGGTSTITTGNISPTANSCMIAFVYIGGTTVGTVGSLKNSGTGIKWVKYQATKVSTDADIEMWAAFNSGAQTNITVTATTSSASMNMDLDVFDMGNVDTTGSDCSGAIASSSIKVDTGGTNQPTITQNSSARAGDYFIWATVNEAGANALTAGGSQTVVGDGTDSVAGFRYVSVKQNAATTNAGTSVTDNGTWATLWAWGMINVEMQGAAGAAAGPAHAGVSIQTAALYVRSAALYIN